MSEISGNAPSASVDLNADRCMTGSSSCVWETWSAERSGSAMNPHGSELVTRLGCKLDHKPSITHISRMQNGESSGCAVCGAYGGACSIWRDLAERSQRPADETCYLAGSGD